MNAYPKNVICALLLPNVRTPLVPTSAIVSQDSMEMASLVTMLTSARQIYTTAVSTQSAITLLALMLAVVFLALKEMDGLVRILTSAKMEVTSVTQMHIVQTLKVPMNAAAILGFAVMVKCATILTNVCLDHMTAVRKQLVRTQWAPIHVRVIAVSMAMVICALTSMSAEREVIFVTLMPVVLTSLARTTARAQKDTLEMDDQDTVTVSTVSIIGVLLL